ncbi:MAG: large conductance mechanosensitive channel protein MscL [Xanthobacteraceae bacterium]|nr:large conductance mechanosensitive channel protein MscL [Xanthobacteraceae bacterium]MBX3522544.1 large conductance mechanosensitive channel protein MscL [Xanthobacteraceae bacterium]MBX3535625.1 large conductance mechanosensitive channel protein MscL [Xanthobacteraceae bacterium]MBX3549195.1 large conductance mechanosensitive channel protein MscL [Xanthobacteraceae bacterium]MCW5673663.1 large conductance mechanosensitive channel protein MscL [Xanthobacteraceae bacterium]
MWEEFKKFALKGNVVDLAVAVIIGAAFGKIVESVVGDLFMPIIGAVLGGLDFSNYFLPLAKSVTASSLAEAKKQGAVLAYGSFLTVVINFAIIAAILFAVVKAITRLRAKEAEKPAEPAAPTEEVKLLTEIRDALVKR